MKQSARKPVSIIYEVGNGELVKVNPFSRLHALQLQAEKRARVIHGLGLESWTHAKWMRDTYGEDSRKVARSAFNQDHPHKIDRQRLKLIASAIGRNSTYLFATLPDEHGKPTVGYARTGIDTPADDNVRQWAAWRLADAGRSHGLVKAESRVGSLARNVVAAVTEVNVLPDFQREQIGLTLFDASLRFQSPSRTLMTRITANNEPLQDKMKSFGFEVVATELSTDTFEPGYPLNFVRMETPEQTVQDVQAKLHATYPFLEEAFVDYK